MPDPAEPIPSPPPAEPVSILLADDSPANLLALRAALDELGHTLVEARSGEEAVALARARTFAAVLLDVRMPGLDGFDTAGRIRAEGRSRTTPILFLTAGDAGPEETEAGYALGAVDVLVKPLSPGVVRAKVRAVVALFQEAERARRESEELRLLVQQTTDYAIFMLDPGGRVATWNAGAERAKGYRADEIIGQHFSRFYPQEAVDRGWPEHELRVAAADGRFEDEGWRVRKDGSTFWANVVITALRDETGGLRGFSKVTRDLTGRKRAEEDARRLAAEQAARAAAEEAEARLRASEERVRQEREWLSVTLASIGDAVIATDGAGRVTFLNPVAEALTGWPRAVAAGQPLDAVFPILNERTRRPVENPVEKVLRHGAVVGLANHTVLVSRDGTERPIDDSAAPIRDAGGALVGVVLIFRDVSEQRRAEEGLREKTATAEALLHIGRQLAEELDLHKLVQIVTDEGTRLCGAQFGAFFYNVVGDRGEAYTLYTLSGVPREAFSRFPMPRNTALFGPTFRGEGVVRIGDVLRDPRYGKSAPHHGMPEGHLPVRSYLAVPVTSRSGEVLGGLFFGHEEADVFTAYHERLLASIAGQAAVAIDNARLYQRAQSSAERLNLALSAAALGDWGWDAATDGVTFSARAAEVFGVAPGPDLTWTGLQALIHPDDRDRARREVERVVAERAPYDIEYRVRRPDGREVWVGALGRATYTASGAVVGMYGVVQDVTARKALEGSLRASESRFRGLVEQAPFSVQLLSGDGRTVRVNRAWEELWGLTLDQLDGYNVLEDRQLEAKGVLSHVRRAFAGEPAFVPPIPYDPTETIPGRKRTGEDPVRWVAAVAYPLKDEAGVVREVVLVHNDITAQRRAEAALTESEERFRQLADAMPQLVWTAGADGQIDYMNRRWAEFTGLPVTAGNAGWSGLLHPAEAAAAREQWAASVATGRPFEAELRLFDHRERTYRWHLVRTVPVLDGGGRVARWFGTGTDIHGQKRDEQTARFLADTSAALAVLVDFDSTLQKVASLAVPYFADWATVDVLEADGTLRRVAVAHVDPAKVQLAHDLHRRFPPDPAAPTGVWNILKTGQPELIPEISDDLLVRSIKDPEYLGVIRELGLRSYVGVPLTVRGKVIGVLTYIVAESGHRYDEADLGVAKDLASRAAIAIENAQLYRELRDADRRKDEFLATLAHELRNPLAPIRNGLQVLKLAGAGGDRVADARTMMERQLGQMVRLVDDLLDVSRITRNKLELKKERVDLATVLHSAVETSRPLVEQFGHTLSVTLPPAAVHLHADPVRLAQVFSNLLNNAAKYTEPGGRIWLTAEASGPGVVVRVRDTGVGIPADSLSRVFEMFSQVDRTLERAQGGLGIGLTLVRRLLDLHGGTVEAHSEGPGRGSEFVVRLPVAGDGREQGREAMRREGAAISSGRRILVVDDNQDSAESLGMMLELMGNEVRTAHDGVAAVAAAADFRPGVILLDIGLPKLNGYEVCRRIRAEAWGRGTVIVALTGWGQDEDRRRSKDAGFDHHLVKPVDADELGRLLAAATR